MSISLTRNQIDPTAQNRNTDIGLFQSIFNGMVRGWRRRKMINALESMDDRLLRDIGLYRVDIEHVVNSFDDRELRMGPLASTIKTSQPEYEGYARAA